MRGLGEERTTNVGEGRDIYLDGRYAELNPSYHVEDSQWKARQVVRALSSAGVTPSLVAEVGCGAGEILAQLEQLLQGPVTLVGWDISPQAFELATSRTSSQVRFRQGDFLAENRERFDVILCLDVFEHVEDYIGFLRRLRGHGEWKVFHIPLEISVQSVLRMTPILRQRRQLGHLHHFSRETALHTLEIAGYEVTSWFYAAGTLELPDRSWLQRLARLPRRVGRRMSADWTARTLGGFSLVVLAR